MASAANAAGSASSAVRKIGQSLGGIGIVGGVADYIEGNGFDKARAAAGDVLRPIFGGVPWEMSAGEIVDAVVPNFLPDVVPGAAAQAADSAMAVVTLL